MLIVITCFITILRDLSSLSESLFADYESTSLRFFGNKQLLPNFSNLSRIPTSRSFSMDDLGCLPGLPPGGMRKHRTRQRAMRAAFMLLSLLHLAIGSFLVYEKCFLGWHVIGFTCVRSLRAFLALHLNIICAVCDAQTAFGSRSSRVCS